jgi:hydrogenase maturation protein HypF
MLTARYLVLSGQVQGVGFRPFVYRLALAHDISGWVKNSTGRVEIHAQGAKDQLRDFTRALIEEAPEIARPVIWSDDIVQRLQLSGFQILDSDSSGKPAIHVPPDYFTCSECLHEMMNPRDRRHAYPFINCTQCGPRYTLIDALPYDRANTSMAGFPLCKDCAEEYTDPADRRFHAEPVACARCGPKISFGKGEVGDKALDAALDLLLNGGILAMKGIGGYHLMCDATNDDAVQRLRERKLRPHKPLAVMFPAPLEHPLKVVGDSFDLEDKAVELLLSPARPIVLCGINKVTDLSPFIAPGLNEIGIMMPYSPLHHILLEAFNGPLVATSGNLSGEPVITDEKMSEDKLSSIADGFLHHNRPIIRPADDSVFRVVRHKPMPLRLGRGIAPLELELPFRLPRPVLATGGQMKNTVALAWDSRVVISPHIGDLGTIRSLEVFEQVIHDLQRLYQVTVEHIVCDAHPGYSASHWARQQQLPFTRIPHHRAHASALALDMPQAEDSLVFTWDGVGFGEDGTLWGGESFLGKPGQWKRFSSLRPFRLPGGEKAGREPWRSAAGLCWELGLDYGMRGQSHIASTIKSNYSTLATQFDSAPVPLQLLHSAWEKRLNAPVTSAMGRLFDAAASLLGQCDQESFEGQGPMLLEAACVGTARDVPMPVTQSDAGHWVFDWANLLPILQDHGIDVAQRAAIFHESMASLIVQTALIARKEHGISRVGFSGGVFQNCVLTERAASLLEKEGFEVVLSTRVPANDGGLSLGQIIEYGYRTTA